MEQTTWVINVLDDSNQKSIEYKNRFWLRQHVSKMKIRVCAEDCVINIFQLVERWRQEETILVQRGEILSSTYDFCKDEEALFLVKHEDGYRGYMYTPE